MAEKKKKSNRKKAEGIANWFGGMVGSTRDAIYKRQHANQEAAGMKTKRR